MDGRVFRSKAAKPDWKYPTWLKAGLILQAGEYTQVIQTTSSSTNSAHLDPISADPACVPVTLYSEIKM